jgi:hypothetical protein
MSQELKFYFHESNEVGKVVTFYGENTLLFVELFMLLGLILSCLI